MHHAMPNPRHISRLAALSAALLALTLSSTASAPAASLDTVDIGCLSHARYDRLFKPGPVIAHLTPDWYVPQGLTAWPKHNQLIVSYYYPHADPDVPGGPREAVLGLIDRAGGNVAKTLRLSNMTGHAGGIAIGGGYLWVASEDGVYRYDADRLESTASGGAITGRRFDLDYDAAYLTFAGGDLWVGNFVETGKGGMRRYDIGAGGNLLTEEPKVTITTPPRVQGVVVRPRAYIFRTSYGRGNSSLLVTTTRMGKVRAIMIAPAMTEGATFVDGKFFVVSESGARIYTRPSEGGTLPCTPPTLRIQRTPVTNLIP